MEFGSGFQDAKTLGDAGLGPVPFQFQGMDLPAEGFLIRETLPEATAMLGAGVSLQPPG